MKFFSSLTRALFSTIGFGPRPFDRMNIENDAVQERVVIIGGGIIGLSTAYSLALDLKRRHDCPRRTFAIKCR